MLTNPVEFFIIRNDPHGGGGYGAARRRADCVEPHKGVDLCCKPGEWVRSPIAGVLTRRLFVYPDSQIWTGAEIVSREMTVKVFYIDVLTDRIGKRLDAGELIGTAQNISERYTNEMKPHIHLEITSIDPVFLMGLRDGF